MLKNFIRAWNNKAKSFDISYQLGTGVLTFMKQCAEQKIQLPEKLRKTQPSLNEMYLSFMDPAGEIINFQFIEEVAFGCFRIVDQMYFKTSEEKRRKLIFEHVGYWVIETNVGDQIIHKPPTEDMEYHVVSADDCKPKHFNMFEFDRDSWVKSDAASILERCYFNESQEECIIKKPQRLKLSDRKDKATADMLFKESVCDFGLRIRRSKPWSKTRKTIDGK